MAKKGINKLDEHDTGTAIVRGIVRGNVPLDAKLRCIALSSKADSIDFK